MLLFILGLGLFFGIHMLPFFPEYRALIIEKIDSDRIEGEPVYKVIFAVIALLGLVFAGLGKGSMEFIGLWNTPTFFRYVSVVIILVSFILMVAAYLPNNIKRYVQHPMLMGMIIWAAAHLLVNGDVAAIILFACFIVYSVVAIILINQRPDVKNNVQDTQESIPIEKDAIVLGIAVTGFLLLLWLHEPLFGRAVFL